MSALAFRRTIRRRFTAPAPIRPSLPPRIDLRPDQRETRLAVPRLAVRGIREPVSDPQACWPTGGQSTQPSPSRSAARDQAGTHSLLPPSYLRASAPAISSEISLVILACRARFYCCDRALIKSAAISVAAFS